MPTYNSFDHIIKNTSSKQEIDTFLRENQITINGDAPPPVLKFYDINMPSIVGRMFKREGYTEPTCIQSTAWPIVLQGRDMVGIAQTGSGKTLAYILPAIISNLQNNDKSGNPQVVVLAPTRELAQQIHQVAIKFDERYIRCCCLFGGAPKGPQIRQCRRGIEICIATPGRLIDLLKMRVIDISKCQFLVLDEADRMLDMGFEPQVREIIKEINPNTRQTLMWSATWPRQVQKLAEEFLKNYIQITVGSNTHTLTANHNIEQIISICGDEEKFNKLLDLLSDISKEQERKTIIFAETKKKVDELVNLLKKERLDVIGIHGDKNQVDRDWILRAFTRGKYQIMIATDVAGRGLDVDDIKFVINYDYPNSSEDYVHRIGRTGRRGQTGTAYTFFTRKNARHCSDLIAVLREANQVVPKDLASLQRFGGGGKYNNYQRYNRYSSGGGGNSGGYGGRSQGSYGNKNFNSYKENNFRSNNRGGGYSGGFRSKPVFRNNEE